MSDKPRVNATIGLELMHPVRTRFARATAMRIGDAGDIGVAFAHACNLTFDWTAKRSEDFRSAFLDEFTEAPIKP